MDQVAKTLGPDTLLLFTADHGSQFPFGKWNLYDAGVRTPLVVSWPGKIQAGSTSTALVSWIDLLPTLVAAAGGTPPTDIDGKSFLGVLEGQTNQLRDQIFLTHSADGRMNQYPQRGVRTARYKLIRNLAPTAEHHTHVDKAEKKEHNYWDSWAAKAKTDPAAAKLVEQYHHRPAEEFYDLENDPNEEKNLIDDPAVQKSIGELRAALDAWMKSNRDQGMATERNLTLNPPGKNAANPKKPQ
jgi:N-sulfoglucosamine sulfohydrolase